MNSRSNTIASHFDKICLVLEALGYLTGDGGRDVSDYGRMLARIYAELDLVTAECVRAGVLAGLTHPQLAAILASLVFEARRSDEAGQRPRMPDARSNAAMIEVRRIWHEVSLVERDARLERAPEPDIGFSEAAYGWAAGRTLSAVLHGSDFTAGDFVRWIRQVADFAGQIADAAGPGDLRDTARHLARSMRRGVVSYAPEMDADEGDDLTGADLP
jgi:ATP-dependent RNA helicase HelY